MERYRKLLETAKAKITEITPAEAAREKDAIVIDVRDRDEWEAGHLPHARHLSRGLLEVEIEELVPNLANPIILHCGAGGRSALAAESLQKMDTPTSNRWPAATKPGKPLVSRLKIEGNSNFLHGIRLTPL